MSDRSRRDDTREIPLTRVCPECQEEMELITADDVGEVLVYECPECGSQEEIRIENESEDDETAPTLPGPDIWIDDEAETDADADQDELDDSE
ncbi:MAG TPA: zf-TFIIB domain-containing protein [bacterium]|nr:zf-TFIIB domain-containing protein [bacterium]